MNVCYPGSELWLTKFGVGRPVSRSENVGRKCVTYARGMVRSKDYGQRKVEQLRKFGPSSMKLGHRVSDERDWLDDSGAIVWLDGLKYISWLLCYPGCFGTGRHRFNNRLLWFPIYSGTSMQQDTSWYTFLLFDWVTYFLFLLLALTFWPEPARRKLPSVVQIAPYWLYHFYVTWRGICHQCIQLIVNVNTRRCM